MFCDHCANLFIRIDKRNAKKGIISIEREYENNKN